MAKSKRRYVWVGKGELLTPVTDASTSVGNVMEIVPAILRTSALGADTNCLVEALYINVSTRRSGVTTFDAAGLIVWTANVVEGGDSPAQTLDALSLDDRAYANKNIMVMAPLEVPPILGASDLATFIQNDEIRTTHLEYQAKRKLDRSNQVLALIINTDVSSVIRCFVQVRCLLSYGS